MNASRLVFLATIACTILAFLWTPANAIELRYDSGNADDYTFQLTDGYLVRFTAPDFVDPFINGVSFFGARFGEPNGAKPQTGYIAVLDADYNKIVSREFNYSDVSKVPSWNHFSIEPVVVRDTKYGAVDYVEKPFTFWVYFLMPSNADAGVMIGKDIEPANLRSRIGNHAAGFKTVSDGKYNWMIRCEVTDGPPSKTSFTSDDLKGAKFIVKDGGVNAGFLSLYKYGATISFETPTPMTIDKLYIYGKLSGNWFDANREFTMYLLDSDLRVCGETELRVIHCLIANPGTRLEMVKRVYSHPQALGQCRSYLSHLTFELVPTYDTAGSVKMIKEQKITDGAAIAGTRAAEIYGMQILAREIEDNPNNFTRFFILSTEDSPPTGDDKTSIVFSVKHKPGALYEFLRELADNKINLTKIESRPSRQKPWEYNFYLDFEGHHEDKIARQALDNLEQNALFVKVLGSYPKAK